MLSFSSKSRRQKEAQGYLTKIVNNHCPTLDAYARGEREEQRLNLTMAAFIVPVRAGQIDVAAAKSTVTKEFSIMGISVVLDRAMDAQEAIVAIQWDGTTTYFRGEIKHQSPIGAGLWQCGILVTEVVPTGEYPELAALEF